MKRLLLFFLLLASPDLYAANSAFQSTTNTNAPSDATYITQTANGSLSAEQNLDALSTGIMRVATATGIITSLTTSAGISANISDETGTGVLVFGTAPTFTTSIDTPLVTLTGTGTINGLDAIDATGEATLEATLDIAGDVSSTGMATTVIGADKVLESMLKAVDAAVDEECLTYETTTGDFEWQACGSGTPGGSDTQVQFNDGGAFGGDAGMVYNKTNDTLTLIGAADANRLLLRSHSTQTSDMFVIEEDGGVDAFVISINPAMSGTENHISGNTAGDSITTGDRTTLYGEQTGTAITTGVYNTLIGARAGILLTGDQNVCVGHACLDSTTSGDLNSGLGTSSCNGVTIGDFNVCVGANTGPNIGAGTRNTLLGYAADAASGVERSIALGMSASATASNQMVVGQESNPISNIYLGQGVTETSPDGVIVQATGGSGTDINGADLTLAAGKSTGNAAGGDIIFQTSTAGSTGTTLQTLATRATISGNTGNMLFTAAVTSSGNDLGWKIVDQTDNQACTTGCTSACVFGIENATGVSVTGIVSCDATTSDFCACAGAS